MENNLSPLISVLMPAFNAEKYIREAIQSIIDQTYQNWELLICDDASTDATYQIAKSYEFDIRIKVYQNKENLKKPITTNRLYEQSCGGIISIHDADDVSLNERFEEIVKVFSEERNVYMCGHNIQRMTEHGIPLPLFRTKSTDYNQIKCDMTLDNTDGDSSIFIKRKVIEDLGEIFRPYFKNNMDYDLALRVIEKYETTNIPKTLLFYRNVPNSISKGVGSYHKLITQDITKFLAKQRKELGADAIQQNDYKTLKELEIQLSQPYLLDKTLHYRKMAEFFMYCRMNKTAINYMLAAIEKEPFKFINWRTLQYCIRKSVFGL